MLQSSTCQPTLEIRGAISQPVPAIVRRSTPSPTASATVEISLNTVVAGLAVTQFLQLLTDFMGAPGEIERMRYDPLNGIVHRGRTMPPDDCLCRQVRGFGNLKRLPVKSDLSFLER